MYSEDRYRHAGHERRGAACLRCAPRPRPVAEVVAPARDDRAVRTLRPTPRRVLRLILTYDDPTSADGKTTADSDIVEAHFLDIVPNTRVVQAVDFVSDDPAFVGTMTVTWEVAATHDGTEVTIRAEDVPSGISPEDHAAGLASSLTQLAAFVESLE